ncbi:putative flap endonuclease-1-like 5' DNA nuclease [Lewinella aquimaris]|uniref:Putative flap endonuclease-1-like 5' DNA nuclease n=1 Tax=Neolewinella aquimaris TaxID=1835722 RepID=A0A840ED84_9BACT|nr:hypothetical protein [Neolewinella aquimaris]MBB4079938.1 putative flap endonuclease-1-like 5' DNA nuclease [Neolewinella aquimaris]
MASFKKELKAIMSRFDAAQEAFSDGVNKQEKTKKKLKSAKAKIKSLEQKIASLEQELKVSKKKTKKVPDSAAGETPKAKSKRKYNKSKETKSTGALRSRSKKESTPVATSASDNSTSSEEMAQAVSDAPDTVSEAAAEKTAPKSRRGRPRKTQGAAKSNRKTATARKSSETGTGTGRRGRPSTKGPASELTKISGVGATMATRFEEAGVKTVEQFATLSDDDMKDVLQKCGPRYRNADGEKMESYRSAAREAMAS